MNEVLFSLGDARLSLGEADITTLAVDAIVNAANERMLGGGGVDGAIHRAAGRELMQACHAVAEVRPNVRCPTGEARITPGFELPAHWVIHTVGPVYQGDESAAALEQAYRSSLALAAEHELDSVAFPAISCGVYGYPLADAARIALKACREHAAGATHPTSIRFALFGREAHAVWLRVATELLG